MELFILQTGKNSDVIELTRLLQTKTKATDVFLSKTRKRYNLPLWLHMASTLHQINQQVKWPLSLWMMLLEYRGLSRIGRILQNFVGQAPSSRTYDSVQDDLLLSAEKEIKTVTESGKCIIAIDNYTHRYGSSALTSERETQYHLPT